MSFNYRRSHQMQWNCIYGLQVWNISGLELEWIMKHIRSQQVRKLFVAVGSAGCWRRNRFLGIKKSIAIDRLNKMHLNYLEKQILQCSLVFMYLFYYTLSFCFILYFFFFFFKMRVSKVWCNTKNTRKTQAWSYIIY